MSERLRIDSGRLFRRQTCIGAILLSGLIAWPAGAFSDTPRTHGLVEVVVTYQENVPAIPWQWQEPGIREGYGVTTRDGWVLTTEGLVRNHRLVELIKPRSGRKLAAQVVRADPRLNLAILKTEGAVGPVQAEYAALAEAVDRARPVTVLQLDATREIQSEQARLLEVSMSGLPDAPYRVLAYTILTDVNVQRVGAPVLQDDRLAGLIMSYDAGSRSGQLIPADVISRFVADNAEPPYEGVAAAGFFWDPLVDETRRRYFKVPDDAGGIEVLYTVPDTGAAATLQANDVILEWDGHRLDELGFYRDPVYGRMEFPLLISYHGRPDQRVPVLLVRDGRTLEVEVQLTRQLDAKALIPENIEGEPASYLVGGGFVLRELTGRYLRAAGGDWQKKRDSRLVYLYNQSRFNPQDPGRRIVLLTNVLPDPINVGYQGFSDMIVESVNRQPIRNLADAFRIVEQDGDLYRIGLRSIGIDLVLDRALLQAANQRIQREYLIPALQNHNPGSP